MNDQIVYTFADPPGDPFKPGPPPGTDPDLENNLDIDDAKDPLIDPLDPGIPLDVITNVKLIQ